MLRKIFPALLAVIALALPSRADIPVGTWKVYSLFGNGVDRIIETPSQKVYYLSSGCLYSYDPVSGESYTYTVQNKLTGENITGIYYNYEKKYLAVAYADGNIDVIYDNGKSLMLPDIKDSPINTTLGVNDITFHGDRMYVATDFGFVVYDDKRFEVKEYGIYNQKVKKIAVNKDHLLLNIDYAIYSSPIDVRHDKFDSFTRFFGANVQEFIPINDNLLGIVLPINDVNRLRIYDLNYSGSGDYYNNIIEFNNYTPYKGFGRMAGGDTYFYTNNKIVVIDNEGREKASKDIPSGIQKNAYGMYKGFDCVWAGDDNGIGCYDITGSELTVVSDKYAPEAVSCSLVQWLIPSPDGRRLYLTNIEGSNYRSSTVNCDGYGDLRGRAQTTNVIDLVTSDIRNVTPSNVVMGSGTAYNAQQAHGNTYIYGSVQRVAEDPDDPDAYYLAVVQEGVFRIKNGEYFGRYAYWRDTDLYTQTTGDTIKNADLGWRGLRPYDVQFDPEGNMWVAGTAYSTRIHILPAEKRRLPMTDIHWQRNDWIYYEVPNVSDGKDANVLICRQSPMAFFYNGNYGTPIGAIDTRGTYTNISDDLHRSWTNLTDQDGKVVNPIRKTVMREDKLGRVWLGTDDGIFEFTNPREAINANFTVKHLKVPRNDGTGQADYLLNGIQINDISVDAANRKWIATETGGLYLVSPDGDEILANFNTTNSDITTNCIYSVYADQNSNVVYVGTGHGLLAYGGNASKPEDDYKEVNIFPNPVRPDYSGWVTINGLMDNSLVKIVDASGATVFQTISEGGMAQWDACNASGHRVRSGVYFVFASQNGESGNAAVVGKIVVVN